jgi:hypothetical protein
MQKSIDHMIESILNVQKGTLLSQIVSQIFLFKTSVSQCYSLYILSSSKLTTFLPFLLYVMIPAASIHKTGRD